MQVPNILGVNLSDVDLLEFLQQVSHDPLTGTFPFLLVTLYSLPSLNTINAFLSPVYCAICSLLIQMVPQQYLLQFFESLIWKHAEVNTWSHKKHASHEQMVYWKRNYYSSLRMWEEIFTLYAKYHWVGLCVVTLTKYSHMSWCIKGSESFLVQWYIWPSETFPFYLTSLQVFTF